MHEVDWTLWNDWTGFEALDWSTVPAGPRAYVIAASQPVNRAVGTDPDGYLDVGESDSLSDRLWSFRRCATRRGSTGHMAGWRFAFVHFDRQFPFSSLRVRWVATKTKDEAVAAESKVLLGYLRRHCELPPLNYDFNWQVFDEHGYDILDQSTDAE